MPTQIIRPPALGISHMADALPAFSNDPVADPLASGSVKETLAAVYKNARNFHAEALRCGIWDCGIHGSRGDAAGSPLHPQPGTASCPDGISPNSGAGQERCSILCRHVCSYWPETGRTATEKMLGGVISHTFKAGDAALPGNYWPITHLNTGDRQRS